MKSNKKYEDIGFAKLDHHRAKRKGFPEVVFAQGKTPEQVARIMERLFKKSGVVMATRATEDVYKTVNKHLPGSVYYKEARIISIKKGKGLGVKGKGGISIITAGTADIPVAEEAAVTAELMGHKVDRIFDVGVAGIHRLMSNLKRIRKASVLIVVAGMEGALASVVAGLVDIPVIAVPTSVGYGASFKGLSALLTMLNSCAPGIATVNIDNGFGSAVMASTIIRSKAK